MFVLATGALIAVPDVVDYVSQSAVVSSRTSDLESAVVIDFPLRRADAAIHSQSPLDLSQLQGILRTLWRPDLVEAGVNGVLPLHTLDNLRKITGVDRYKAFERTFFPSFNRVEDIAGQDIPEAWKEFTEQADPTCLLRVIQHNLYDLVTEEALYLMLFQESMRRSWDPNGEVPF